MLEYERKVSAFIERHQLIQHGDRVLIAVSGGPDSLSLLHFLSERQLFYGIEIAGITIDHMLRGQQSLDDLLYVRAFCSRLEVPCEAASIDILTMMETEGKGMQETARTYRYRFFEETMVEKGYTKLAMGHHGEDQAETILMRLTRGAIGKSRAGIPLKRPFAGGEIIRPLLNLKKRDIEDYCRHYQLEPRRDPSNEKEDYTRNRFRHRILPALRAENPQYHEQFERFSEELREDEHFLQELTKAEMNKLWNIQNNEISFGIKTFHQMPLPLQRRGIQLILNYLYEELPSSISAVHIEAIQQLIRRDANSSGRLDLPKQLKIIRSYNSCCFTFQELIDGEPYEYDLPSEGELLLPNGDKLEIHRFSGHLPLAPRSHNRLYLDPTSLKFPLSVRTRRTGDKMAVKGLNGTKKVKEIFIDSKVPGQLRDSWPILTDGSGQILWIPGIKKSKFDIEPAADTPLLVLHYHSQTSSRGPFK